MIKRLILLVLFTGIIVPALAQAPVMQPISGPTVVCSAPALPQSFSTSASNSPVGFFWSVFPSGSVSIVYSSPTLVSISFSYPGSYTIACYASNPSGPSSAVYHVVTVNETPKVSFSGASIYCQGSPTSIQASPTTIGASSTISYSWTPPAGLSATNISSPFVSPAVTTNYSVSFAMGACTNTAQVTVSVAPSPTLSAVINPPFMCQNQSCTLAITGNATSYFINANPSSTTTVLTGPFLPGNNTYTVAGLLGSCAFTAHASMFVYPSPTLSAFVNKAQMCASETNTLTISGNANIYYVNTVPGTTVSPVLNTFTTALTGPFTPGTNVFIITGNAGICTSTTSAFVLVNPSPTLNAVLNRTLMCTGESNSITVTGNASSYSVNSVAGGTTVPISTTTTAGPYSYTVSGISSQGCSSSSVLSLSVSACTGIDDLSPGVKNGFLIYPNPNNGEFHIIGSTAKELVLFDHLGRLVRTITLEGDPETRVTGLSPGVYYVVCGSSRTKLIVTE